jgi:hypothetical protein
MDWCFEAGLLKAWEIFSFDGKIFIEKEETLSILNIKDLAVAFYALLVGCAIGKGFLLCEIFWSHFAEPLIERYKQKSTDKTLMRENMSLREIQEKKFSFLRRKVRVRRIQVKPINETDL